MEQYSRDDIYNAIRAADAAGDGESVRRLAEYLQKQSKPASVSVGEQLRDIPRQVGLFGRYGLEALGQSAELLTEPLRVGIVNPIIGAMGLPPAASTGRAASALADLAGLPAPRTADERVIGDATRTGLSALTIGGASKKAADAATGTTKAVLQQMAARPGMQAVAGAGAGAAGGSVREAGGDPIEQFAAALLGGLTAGAATAKTADAAAAGGRLARQLMTPKTEQIRAADQAIDLVLRRSGIDWGTVPGAIKSDLRMEVAQALNTGQPLNADALRRLVVFRRTGTTPTVGMLTQNPGQITREANLSKMGANSMDEALQRLPTIYNENIARLLQQLDEAGAATAPSAARTGAIDIAGLERRARGARGRIDSLYSAARDTEGRSLPLDPSAFTTRANQLLDADNVGSFLPADIARKLNAFATGEIPLTVEIAEQFKTSIGAIQRGSADGNVRRALGLVRQALDDTPLLNQRNLPENMPAASGTVPPSTQPAGEEALRAFNRARAANRAYMQTLEANPALAAVDEAIAALRSNPQLRSVADIVGEGKFVGKYVLGAPASPGQVRTLLRQVGPEGRQALRQYVVRYLRDAATNSTDDITKFTNVGYRKALRDIGDAKLETLFSRDELDQIRAIGDAAKYMQAQPAGSAVNNSNSGALVLGRGLDLLDKIAGFVPLGGRDILRGQIQGAEQRIVLDPRNALLKFVPPTSQPMRINPLLAATVPAEERRQKDRRD